MRKRSNASAFLSHAEFDALPHSVQRKYFSELERLRIAEQQSLEEQHQRCASRRSSHSHTRSIGLHHSLNWAPSRRCRLRRGEEHRIEQGVAQQEVQFFLSLPPKVRKQYFSREEQVLLLGRCDQPLLPNASTSERAQQRFNDFHFFEDADSNPRQERGRSRRRSRSISPSRLPFGQDQQGTQPSHDDTPTHNNTMAPPMSYQMAPKYRRTLSLSNMPVRQSISSAGPGTPMKDLPLLPFGGFGPLQRHARSTSVSVSGRRSSHTPTAPVFDPEATHYRDPEARKKLRMFLASPQKFDEAVEFGFPSTTGEEATTMAPRYQLPPITTDAQNFSRDMQTFLRDDKISFLEDNEDDDTKLDTDGESVTDMDSPVTPSSVGLSFRGHTRHVSPSTFCSMDSAGLPPLHPMQGRLNREMTLRMTLTRPDLRADEEQLYGWQTPKAKEVKEVKEERDPFALEELHLTDDLTGSHSPFAVKPKSHGNLVSRLLKRASMRRR